jgi:hypothetical protein
MAKSIAYFGTNIRIGHRAVSLSGGMTIPALVHSPVFASFGL